MISVHRFKIVPSENGEFPATIIGWLDDDQPQ